MSKYMHARREIRKEGRAQRTREDWSTKPLSVQKSDYGDGVRTVRQAFDTPPTRNAMGLRGAGFHGFNELRVQAWERRWYGHMHPTLSQESINEGQPPVVLPRN